jgi:hypothetical protein
MPKDPANRRDVGDSECLRFADPGGGGKFAAFRFSLLGRFDTVIYSVVVEKWIEQVPACTRPLPIHGSFHEPSSDRVHVDVFDGVRDSV